jgi:putative Mn2+ efflux pump MntP
MGFIESFIIAIGLSMDAFAVSIGKGLSVRNIQFKHSLSVGLWFGGFQALMPIIGYFLGVSFSSLVASVDHWIAFGLLGLIGANMIKESLSKDDDDNDDNSADFSRRTMFIMAVATSIDALAVGVSFAFLGVNIWLAALLIGVTTCILSACGLRIGKIFGSRYKSKAEFCGGLVLILMGLKILIEHLMM